jgi:hypothetical protein
VVDYIEDLLPEVAKTTGPKQRPARLDVLAVCLLKINSFLNGRLTPVMNPNLMDTTKLQLGDVHSVINWLNNYQLMMRDIYCPPLAPDAPVPSEHHSSSTPHTRITLTTNLFVSSLVGVSFMSDTMPCAHYQTYLHCICI